MRSESPEYPEYHLALRRCVIRYYPMAPDDLKPFVLELWEQVLAAAPIPKMCRWLGYIQGVLVERGLTTVEAERDWTRPLFRPLDFPEGS